MTVSMAFIRVIVKSIGYLSEFIFYGPTIYNRLLDKPLDSQIEYTTYVLTTGRKSGAETVYTTTHLQCFQIACECSSRKHGQEEG